MAEKDAREIHGSEYLRKILEHNKIRADIPISSMYCGQLGHLVFSSSAFNALEDSSTIITDWEKSSEYEATYSAEHIADEFLEALKSNPHIFNFQEFDTKKAETTGATFERYSLSLNKQIQLEFKVPARKKQFTFTPDQVEQFTVCLTGSTYFSFAQVERVPSLLYIGQEYREQVRAALGSIKKSFRLGQIGPSPIHPRFYLLDVNDDSYSSPIAIGYEEDIYILVNLRVSQLTPAKTYFALLGQVEFLMNRFFEAEKQRSLIGDLYFETQARLIALMERCLNLHSRNVFFIPLAGIASARKELLMILKRHFEYEEQVMEYEQSRIFIGGLIADDPILKYLTDYFKRIDVNDFVFGPAFGRTLDFIEKSLASSDVAIRTISAAVIGATIGMFAIMLFK